MSKKETMNTEKSKNGVIEKFKAMKNEDKIMIGVIAVIVIAVIVVCLSYAFSPVAEDQHQAKLRAEAQMPECVHVQEAQETLFDTKERMKDNITSGFDEYWTTYEKNFWVEFKKLHEKNHPECFTAQDAN